MVRKNLLEKAFYDCCAEFFSEHNYIYVKKYDMYMKLDGSCILKYIFLEKLSAILKNEVGFALSGNAISIYAQSFEKNELIICALRNKQYVDSLEGYLNRYPHKYTCNEANVNNVMKEAVEDAKQGIFKGIETVNTIEDYLEYCHKINTSQIRLATKFICDSLVTIVSYDHYDMTNTFNEIMDNIEKAYGKSYVDTVSKAYYDGLVESISNERDKVFSNPELYACAMKEAERRKTANLEMLKQNGLL